MHDVLTPCDSVELHRVGYEEAIQEAQEALGRFDAINDGIGTDLQEKFEAQAQSGGGEQYLPDKAKINSTCAATPVRSSILPLTLPRSPDKKGGSQHRSSRGKGPAPTCR